MLAFMTNGDTVNRHQTLCLAKAVYFEARNQDLTTQLSIASFLQQFAERNGVSICEEIYHSRGTRYPWAKHDNINFKNDEGETLIIEVEAWKTAVLIAGFTLQGRVYRDVGDATHFIMPSEVNTLPDWYEKDKIVSTIGIVEYLRLPDYK